MFRGNKHSIKQGFTLIEVVLVLAIGGLIFLLAFLAFSQVAANRRDTQRRNDARRVLAALKNYRADTGSYPINAVNITYTTVCSSAPDPASFHEFVQNYLCVDGSFTGPSKLEYGLRTWGSALVAPEHISYRLGRNCNVADSNSFAVWVNLEKNRYCTDASI